MARKLSDYIRELEEKGLDPKMFISVVGVGGYEKEINNLNIILNVQQEKWCDHPKIFRRWITAHTFRMLYTPLCENGKKLAPNWSTYLRLNYSYNYQFEMMERELKTLAKIEKVDREAFEIRRRFFNKMTVIGICREHANMCCKFYQNNYWFERGLNEMLLTTNYSDLYKAYKTFMRGYNHIPDSEPKIQLWKDTFKGIGAYYTMENMIKFHGCRFHSDHSISDSMFYLNTALDVHSADGTIWKLHKLLKDLIKTNNFHLGNSIRNNSRKRR